jgi:PKD repeat protein
MTSGYRVMGYRLLRDRLLVIGLSVIGGASCRLSDAKPADYAGPSSYGVSLSLAATPDLLQRDGRTTSTVTVSAYDAASRPVAGLGLHLDLKLSDGVGTLGTLSTQTATTGADGRASVTYTSPLAAPAGQSDDATVQILVTPVGSNSSNAAASAVTIRLTSLNLVGGPSASFTASPRTPRIGDTILFDASASQPSTGASIVSWFWDFGDGNASPRVPYLTGSSPTFTHEYNKGGNFTVGLTVLDSAGHRATATMPLTINQ